MVIVVNRVEAVETGKVVLLRRRRPGRGRAVQRFANPAGLQGKHEGFHGHTGSPIVMLIGRPVRGRQGAAPAGRREDHPEDGC